MIVQFNQVALADRLQPLEGDIAPGQQIHLLGPNGAGKSSLLAITAGLLPAQGQLYYAGKPLSSYNAKQLAQYRAYLPQQQSPLTLMSVFQFLCLYQPSGADRHQVDGVINELCQHMKLSDKLARSLAQLSGGEWQRVRLVAVFLQVWPSLNPDSRLLLLDEPTTGLDIGQQLALDQLLKAFCQDGRSAMISSHNLNHSLQQADQVWLLQEGRRVAAGPTAQVLQPALLSDLYQVEFQLHEVAGQRWLVSQSM